MVPKKIHGLPVKTIGSGCFASTEIESVVVPDSVKEIGDFAFCYAQASTVVIPDSVEKVGAYALHNLTGRNFGVSAGVFNVESPDGRLGNDGQFSWLPGLQVGLVNGGCGVQTGFYNIGGSLQIGALNADGSVQIGLLNAVINGDGGDYGDCSASLQIGLINYNPHGIFTCLPIINFSRGRKD